MPQFGWPDSRLVRLAYGHQQDINDLYGWHKRNNTGRGELPGTNRYEDQIETLRPKQIGLSRFSSGHVQNQAKPGTSRPNSWGKRLLLASLLGNTWRSARAYQRDDQQGINKTSRQSNQQNASVDCLFRAGRNKLR